ncbi:MAG: HXXEE domain-containing protein [Bacteroidales bacterium]|nr:HXXEE domain-containing protein [Bacteroidales bacterium]
MTHFNYIIWLFPLLFVFHDAEELIGMGRWIENNKEFIKNKVPKFYDFYQYHSNKGMAIAILEELIGCLAICFWVMLSNDETALLFWWGTFCAFTIHLLVHIGQCVFMRKYVPCVATSIICLPISIYILYKTAIQFDFEGWKLVVYSIIGAIVVAVNLIFALWLMRKLK